MPNIDLKFYFQVFLRRLPYFLVVAALISAVGLTLAAILPPTYRSEASILVEPQQISGELVQATVEVNPYEQAQIIAATDHDPAEPDRARRARRALRRAAGDDAERDGRRHRRADRVHRLHRPTSPRSTGCPAPR